MSAGSGVLRVTILGCGSSGGVPRVGGEWGDCDPTNPKNERTRCSILVERKHAGEPWEAERTTTIIVDTSPDLRTQLLAAEVKRVDAVLFTHHHADQSHGIDDLRPFVVMSPDARVPVYMDEPTANILGKRFDYLFHTQENSLYRPIMDLRVELEPGRITRIDGPGGPIDVLSLAQQHGPIPSLGFRFGPVAYSNDLHAMPNESFAALDGLEGWIVDALKHRPHPSHAHLARSLEWIERVKPERAYLTDMHVDMDYDAVNAETPEHVSPCHDGLRLEFEI